MPNKLPVSFVMIDNHHLTKQGIRYFCARSKEFVLVTSNADHPAFQMDEDNLHIICQSKLSLTDALAQLKSEYGCQRITIQSGGTLNGLFLREKLFDYIDIVIAPILVGGKDTSTPVSYTHLTRKKLPFGVCQVGKSFRNEITPGNFIFRIREFEQMELEFFCQPGTDLEWFQYWREFCRKWLVDLGLKEENLRLRDHEPEELAFYSKATTDFEFMFPFGWGELWGVADRTDYDLKQHQEHSGKDLRCV